MTQNVREICLPTQIMTSNVDCVSTVQSTNEMILGCGKYIVMLNPIDKPIGYKMMRSITITNKEMDISNSSLIKIGHFIFGISKEGLRMYDLRCSDPCCCKVVLQINGNQIKTNNITSFFVFPRKKGKNHFLVGTNTGKIYLFTDIRVND